MERVLVASKSTKKVEAGAEMEVEETSPFVYTTLAPLFAEAEENLPRSLLKFYGTPAGNRTAEPDESFIGLQAEEEPETGGDGAADQQHAGHRGRSNGVDRADEGDSFISFDGYGKEEDFLAVSDVEPDVKTPGASEPLARTASGIKRRHVAEALNKDACVPPPWAAKLAGGNWIQSPLLQLHKEIVEFSEFVSPTKEEHLERVTAVERVSAAVKSIWPSCEVHVFGSFATGLYLPTSDVDVVVLKSGCQVRKDGLRALAKTLSRRSLVKKLQVIANARVPIVKFVESQSNINFDISFDVANGPQAASFIKEAMEQLPPLKPLCLVLKIFLQQRELNEVYSGGIGSYALLVMLLTHLQTHPSRWQKRADVTSGPLVEENLGMLLVDFFELYGRILNAREVGVSCRNGGGFYSKKSRGFTDVKRPYLLSVEDPQTPENDIGKNSYAIQKVQSAFALAHQLLTTLDDVDEAIETTVNVGILGRIVRMDKKLVSRKSLGFPYVSSPAVAWPIYTPGTGQYLADSDSDDFQPRSRKRSRRCPPDEEPFPRGHGGNGRSPETPVSSNGRGTCRDLETPGSSNRRGDSRDLETPGPSKRRRKNGYFNTSPSALPTKQNKSSNLGGGNDGLPLVPLGGGNDGTPELSKRLSRKKRLRAALEKKLGRVVSKREWKIYYAEEVKGKAPTNSPGDGNSRKRKRSSNSGEHIKDEDHGKGQTSLHSRKDDGGSLLHMKSSSKQFNEHGKRQWDGSHSGSRHSGLARHVASNPSTERATQGSRYPRVRGGATRSKGEHSEPYVQQGTERRVVQYTPGHKKIKFL